jgi:hypothetical protein
MMEAPPAISSEDRRCHAAWSGDDSPDKEQASASPSRKSCHRGGGQHLREPQIAIECTATRPGERRLRS